jgi:hypothetical protein
MGIEMREHKKVLAAKKSTVDAISGRSNKLDAINFDKDSLPDSLKQELKRQAGV